MKAIDELQDSFANTNWDLFKEDNDPHVFTDTVTGYVHFFPDLCVPTKTITQYPNGKQQGEQSIIKANGEAYFTERINPELKQLKGVKESMDTDVHHYWISSIKSTLGVKKKMTACRPSLTRETLPCHLTST